MFDSQIKVVIDKYPKLHKVDLLDSSLLKGYIDIVGAEGKMYDTYEIEIHPSNDFPKCFPKLFEVGGKIPKNADWHIYNDGSCCVTVLPDEILACKRGITLLSYIENYVIPYLANQTFRRLTGNFANNEYSHGYLGILEFYQNLYKTEDLKQIIDITNWIKQHPKPNRTSICFCGKSEKFRYCHKNTYEIVKIIGEDYILNQIVSIITNYWKNDR